MGSVFSRQKEAQKVGHDMRPEYKRSTSPAAKPTDKKNDQNVF